MLKGYQRAWNAPVFRLAIILAWGLLMVAWATMIATDQGRVETSFEPGMSVTTASGPLVLEDLDFTPEPGELGRDEDLRRFYERQDILAAAMKGASVTIEGKNGAATLRPQGMLVHELPSLFWIQVMVGFGALAISGWVWALRPRDLASSLFAISGLATLGFTVPAAIYTTRALALPAKLFQQLVALNVFGASLFGISMIALFLVYPTRLSRWRMWSIGTTVLFGVWTALAIMGILPASLGVNLITLTEMLGICVAIGVQFFATKRDPKARASLTWLGLSVLGGAGGFIALNAVPLALGIEATVTQAYAFLFFLVIYLGLAAGLRCYRLFEVGHWAFRFFFYAVGAILLVMLDALLMFVVGFERLPALGMALLAVGFLYLPLRDAIWRRFSRRGRMAPHELLAGVLHVAFAPTATGRASRWEGLWRQLFDPLTIEPAVQGVKQVTADADGLSLLIPAAANAPSLCITYPWGGRSLFSPAARELAHQIVTMIAQVESSREAYDRGVVEERRRMAQDLHDDIGARLLTGLHMADEKMRPTFQAALADIRAIVNEIPTERVSLAHLFADARYETERRLSVANIALEWPVFADDAAGVRLLDYRQQKAIRSSVREIVSNVIRHSGASCLTVLVNCEERSLQLSFRDNGRGIPAAVLMGESRSYGLKNLQRRLKDIGGSFHVESAETGSCINLSMPYEIFAEAP